MLFKAIDLSFGQKKDKEMLEKLLLSNVMSNNSSLLFSIEQWELTRRLRNSGLSKEQVCQAFDDLERMERDLGSLYSIPLNISNLSLPCSNTSSQQSTCSNLNSSLNKANEIFTKNMQNFQNLFAKNSSNLHQQQQQQKVSAPNTNLNSSLQNGSNNSNSNDNSTTSSASAAIVVNTHFATIIDPDLENKEIEEFRRFV